MTELDEVSPARRPARDDDGDQRGSGWDSIALVVAAIATGVGVLGLVTFVGGAVQFGRLEAADLPAEDALTVMPTANLIVVGARTLVPAVGLALLAVAVLFLARTVSGASDRNIEEKTRAQTRAATMGLFVLAAEWVCFFLTVQLEGVLEFLVAIGLSVFLAAIVAAVAYKTPRFVWLGSTTFLVMAIFLGVLGYARARDDGDVRPAVVIRDNRLATIGFFIAETDGRVYIGRLRTGADGAPSEARLMAFASSQITDMAIGPAVPFEEALDEASKLAGELCREQPSVRDAPDCWDRPPGRIRGDAPRAAKP